MTILALSQWILFICFAALFFCSSFAFVTNGRARPIAFGIGFISLTHSITYYMFVCGCGIPAETIMWTSLVIRYEVMFALFLSLVLTLRVVRARRG